MSVVSLARIAGVTGLLSNSRSCSVRISLALALINADVDEPLLHDVANQLPILGQRAEAGLAGVMLGTQPGGRQPERHVGVLGVGQDEIAAAGIGQDASQFTVE